MKTIVEKLFENADRYPDKLAVIFEGEEVSYGGLQDAVIRLASWFKLQGVSVGDRIIVQAAFCKWYFAACYAAHLCSAIFVPVEKTLTQETLHSVIQRMGAKAVVSNFMPGGAASLRYQDMDGVLSGIEELPCGFPAGDSTAQILFTSGTTGPQKGAMLTHRNLAANSLATSCGIGISWDDVGMTFMPLNHTASLRRLEAALYNGGTYIFLDGMMSIGTFYRFMAEYHVTSLYLAPSGIAALERLSKDKLHDYADRIGYVYTIGALMQESQRDFLLRMLPRSKLFCAYGSSENGTVSMYRYDRDRKDIRCAGRPCEGVDIRILDDGLNELPRGEQGRVAIRSDMNCKGYWGMPELTESSCHKGYFLTNDAGYLDEDGFLYILGRFDDLINIGGLKVYPSEIEDVALEIKGVEECICFDVPNTLTGSAVKLLIKQKTGAGLDVREIRNALTGKLDTYKIPASIEFVTEIVKTPSGKPDRKYYRKQEGTKQ